MRRLGVGKLAALMFVMTCGQALAGRRNRNSTGTDSEAHPQGLYALGTALDIDGKEVDLAHWANKVSLVVNVASNWGTTSSNYKALERLYREYEKKGFTVLAFPSNDFKNQEPGTEAEIKALVTRKFKVTFPMFSKIHVSGSDVHPVFKFLMDAKPRQYKPRPGNPQRKAKSSEKANQTETADESADEADAPVKDRDKLPPGSHAITWNFNKFLVNRAGQPIKRYPPAMDGGVLKSLERDLNGMLNV